MEFDTKIRNQRDQNQLHESPRLDPIEQPDSLKLRFIYWLARKMMGTVITPLKVVQARLPETIPAAYHIVNTEKKLPISERLKFLIHHFTASQNGCAFCTDIARAEAEEQNVDTAGYRELMKFEESGHFSEAEKAALRYIDQVNRKKRVDDPVFDALADHFSDREITAITWLNAVENYYNMINRPLNIPSDDLCRDQAAG